HDHYQTRQWLRLCLVGLPTSDTKPNEPNQSQKKSCRHPKRRRKFPEKNRSLSTRAKIRHCIGASPRATIGTQE
ncbi:MAG: hypothetical protein ACREFI_03845, partial [Stellaceae bacterium]